MPRTTRLIALLLALTTLSGALAACSQKSATAGLPTQLPTGDATTTTVPLPVDAPPCVQDPNGVGHPAPQGSRPGDLIASSELVGRYAQTEGFPTHARAWRISYVSTGVDEHDLQIVCGMVAAPADGPKEFAGSGRMLAWSHGTSGLQQACLPSLLPEKSLWGKMADGINNVAWGSGTGARNGEAADGALQTALNRGWVVSATDYQPNDTYVIGRVAAADVIDAGRAAGQLMDKTFGDAPDDYDTITWGHSQGGHAAIWAGQLMDTYQDAAPNPGAPTLHLSGVAALAPASNFIVQPELQGIDAGNGLSDWEMHQTIEVLGLPIPALELQVGPALFSYIFGSWAVFSSRGTPAENALTPAFPAAHADLDLSAVTTEEGAITVAQLSSLCTVTDAKLVKSIVSPYRNAGVHKLLVPELWNLPQNYSEGEYFKGGVDKACAALAAETAAHRGSSNPGLASWCDWIRWNLPGPNGDNPFPKVPERDGKPVPMLIGQGMDDVVIHCQSPDGADPTIVPPAANCMSVALFDSLRDASNGYCPAGSARGHLELALFRPDGAASPAGHLTIPGQISAVGSSKSSSDLTFTGSPMEKFMTGAFDATLPDGCTAAVLNH